MKQNLKYRLKNTLNEKEIQLMPTSFDVIGSIMIFSDFPKELIKKEKIIGNEILAHYHHIKTVLKKTRKFSGRYRTPKYRIMAGEKTKETTYKENDVFLKLDVEKVYFSPRLSGERMRIAKLVKENENVLVMFSGSAIYPLVIAKNSNPKIIYGIEINPTAHKYALENLKLNKAIADKIKLIKGDVKKIMPKLNEKFDRIIMPLPKNADNFLDLALKSIKKGGFIHLYHFIDWNEIEKIKCIAEKEFKKSKRKYKIMSIVKCGQYGPNIYRVCVDFKVSW